MRVHLDNERGEPATSCRCTRSSLSKKLVEVYQNVKKNTNRLKGIYGIHLKPMKENRKMSTCNQLDLETLLGIVANYAQKSPQTMHWMSECLQRILGIIGQYPNAPSPPDFTK